MEVGLQEESERGGGITSSKFKWVAHTRDWGRANLCKCLKVPQCLINLVQVMSH